MTEHRGLDHRGVMRECLQEIHFCAFPFPAYDEDGLTLYQGDVLDILEAMPDESVQCVVTSPPYWSLRSYAGEQSRIWPDGSACAFGLEPDPTMYVEHSVLILRELRRVLRKDGVCWWNIGDSYAGSWGNYGGGKRGAGEQRSITNGSQVPNPAYDGLEDWRPPASAVGGLKPKDLVLIPWRVGLAAQADGWWLRSDIIWAKPNPMPESVADRPTKSHEYVLMLTKSERYFWDADAVREGRNLRSVWTIATQPTPLPHFAGFPEALVATCIKASTQAAGKRCDCDEIIATPTGTGATDDPTLMTGRKGMNRERRQDEGTRPITRREQRWHAEQLRGNEAAAVASGAAFAHYIRTDSSGARPLPEHLRLDFIERGWISAAPPCQHPIEEADTVLDPFSGMATTLKVARDLGRKAIGIEISGEYMTKAIERLRYGVRGAVAIAGGQMQLEETT